MRLDLLVLCLLTYATWPRFSLTFLASYGVAWAIDAWTPVHSAYLSYGILVFGVIAGIANQLLLGPKPKADGGAQ